MDISVGSTHMPEYSANLSESGSRVGNTESSKLSEEQNHSQPHAAPTQSVVRFKIRSAKERQQSLTRSISVKSETFEKECREEMPTPRVHTISPSSPDTDIIDRRRPRVLNPLSLTKSIGSETGSTTQKKPDCSESPTTNIRGRTDLRQAYLSNRSKSLDWRGSKNEGGQENQMHVFRNIKDLEGRSIRRSESLETNDTANRTNSNELAHPLKRVSLQIKPYNGAGQRKQDSNGLISSGVSGASPVRTVALAQSFPSRPRSNLNQDRTEEREHPWQSGHSATKPDLAEHHLRSQTTASPVSELSGNHTRRNVLEDNSKVGLGVPFGIITPVTSVHDTDSNLSRSNPTNSSLDGCLSSATISKVKTVSYSPGKCGTFPKASFKKEQMNFTTFPDTSFVSPGKKDNLDIMSRCSKEKPLSQDSTSLVSSKSIYEERRLPGHSTGLGTHSLGRARNQYFTAPIPYSVYSPTNSVQKSTRKEVETQLEKMTSNSKQTKIMETIPGKQSHSSQEGMIPQTKPQSPQSMTAESEKHHHHEHRLGLEFGSSGHSSKKPEGLLEKIQKPSTMDSVRNTIHKFETLALQNQSSSRIHHPRRTLSVTEMPKPVVSVNKAYSARSISVSRECFRETLFSKSKVSDEAASGHDLSGTVQITTPNKEASTVKTQSGGIKSQEPGDAQTSKLRDEFPSDQKNEAKFTMMNKHVDEPDFSKGSNLKSLQKLKNTDLAEEKVRNYLSATVSHNSQKSSGITNASRSDLKDLSPKPTKDKAFLTSENIPVLPNSDSSTTVKSTGNSAHSKSLSNLSDSVVIPPIQVLSSGSGDLSNLYNTLKDEKVAAKVIRWIMDKGVDDENGEDDDDDDEDDEGTERGYDSDSGESSVTITSNMSSKSFSMSLVELRSLGGLDLPSSEGSGSMDDENWMSQRTVSMSSDVSALSSVTLLGMDELERLLNDVRGLENDALEQNYEDVHVVVLHKEAGSGLGFTVAGGVDQSKPVTVHKVLRNGIAAQEGTIRIGDQVLSINGTALHNSTHKEAHSTMKKARRGTMAVVVIRRGDVTETCYSPKDSPQKAPGNPGRRVLVTLNKSSSDLGFSLEGGVGSSLGDKPLIVQRLFHGGPVGKVFPGDELLEVEGQSLEGLRRLEVWHLIKRLPPGPVEVLLQRPYQL